MIKLRQAGYCNLKLFLLYLVIYGHWIEPGIGSSEFLLAQYRFIYLIHMPLFAFLSGLFLRNQGDCLRQIKRLLPIYVLLQLAITVLSGGTVEIWTPWWHLWYLLSNCFWAGIGWLWFRFGRGKGDLLILLISVLLGALAGFAPWLDRTLSGSRTVVFFPYFWAGLISNPAVPWSNYRRLGLAALTAAAAAAGVWGAWISPEFLYHAVPFDGMENGFALRLLCYTLSSLSGFGILTLIPHRRLPCTRVGADTMPAYQWNHPLYGIVPGERRSGRWPVFKKYTSNTANRYTDSFSP